MEVRRLRILALEDFKTLNDLNPIFMKDLFKIRIDSRTNTSKLMIPSRNSVTFGDNSIKCLGPHIWNLLPQEVKTETSFDKFK